MHRLFFTLLLFISSGGWSQTHRFQFTETKMGSPFSLVFYAKDSVIASHLARQSFLLVDSFTAIFSDYLPNSELNTLSATAGTGKWVSPSPSLYQILYQSKNAWHSSRGSFDVTLGPLSKLWRQTRKEKQFPAEEEVKGARKMVGFDKLFLDTVKKQVRLQQAGMQLDLGGIAKGYVAEEVVRFFKRKGIQIVMADAGGDIVCGEAPPGKKGWTIGINIPEEANRLLNETIILQNKAVATSGDVYQFTPYGGKKYSHIIDPKTGYGVTFQQNVTVIAPDGATADWLATACSILPVRKGKRLVKKQNAYLLITQLKKGSVKFYTSRGMKMYLR